MATKRERGGVFHYTVKRAALLPKPLYLSFDNEADGDAYVARLEALLDKGIVPDSVAIPAASIDTITKAIRAYRSSVALKPHDEDVLKVIIDRDGATKLRHCTYDWAEGWIADMKARHKLAPSRIRKFKGSLHRCFDWLLIKHPEAMAVNPLVALPRAYAEYSAHDAARAGVKRVDVERDRRLEPGEEVAIRAVMAGEKPKNRQRPLELPHRDSLVMMFDLALETAMRLRELYTLDWEQVDTEARTIFLDKTKNGDKRQVPLSSVALGLLAGGGEGLIFPWWDGDTASLSKTTSRLSRQYGRIFEAAGAKGLTFHCLRHEATCRLYERTTMTDLQIAKVTGHRDPRVLRRYANLRGTDLAGMMWGLVAVMVLPFVI